MLASYGQRTCGTAGDVTADCLVAVADILSVLSQFGAACAAPLPPSARPCAPRCGAGASCVAGRCVCDPGRRGLSGGTCLHSCSLTAAHRSTLVALESTLPCADCIAGCGALPDWADAGATCAWLDSVYSVGADGAIGRSACVRGCDSGVSAHAVELWLACHGGTGIAPVGGEADTAATLAARAGLVARISGLCFTLQQELGQSWHGLRERCEDLEEQCGAWAARGECWNNPVYMRSQCRLSCGMCSALDPETHLCVTGMCYVPRRRSSCSVRYLCVTCPLLRPGGAGRGGECSTSYVHSRGAASSSG